MIKRYTLPEMGKIWEDEFRFSTWLKIEVLACEAREELGEIPEEDVDVIKAKANFDVERILEIEEETKHDVIAFLKYLQDPSLVSDDPIGDASSTETTEGGAETKPAEAEEN